VVKYLSVCSGIEAATVAWHHMGWQPVAFSDIEPFPSAVLAHHYPNVPNLGDMTQFEEWNLEPIDLLVGGTPCQSFSVAGLRKGLADPRGNLMLTFLAIAQRHRPQWIVWENVPGVLSSNGGRDFGTFLGALGELGYGFAYRVLDAQWFGVAQRRRRVFVVGHLGDWQRPAAVLFKSESVRRDTAPSREAGQEVAAGTTRCFAGSRQSDIAATLETTAHDYSRADGFNMVAQPIGFGAQMSNPQTDVDLMQTLNAKNPMAVAQPVAWDEELNARENLAGAMLRGGDGGRHDGVMTATMQVRRLTPVECERLQGFPDGYTNIPWRKKPESPDGSRYKALGNSMAVPVMRWIGQRIQENDK
jgi:DNA (cytosine-5)-methyltransferase 1